MKLDKLGWVVAAGMAGAMFGMGFQTSSPKFATVDMAKVFSESDFTSSSNGKLSEFVKPRLAVIQFLQQNPPMANQDAEKYAELSIKPARSPADDMEIKRIEMDAQAATSKQHDLVLKQNPTADDNKAMEDFRTKAEANKQFQGALEQKYDQDTQAMRLTLHDQAMEQVRKTVKDVATKQGYTVVFSSDSAPYAANDITPDALKIVKK